LQGLGFFFTSNRGFADKPLEKRLSYKELLQKLHSLGQRTTRHLQNRHLRTEFWGSGEWLRWNRLAAASRWLGPNGNALGTARSTFSPVVSHLCPNRSWKIELQECR
jgi:hypothetical protein